MTVRIVLGTNRINNEKTKLEKNLPETEILIKIALITRNAAIITFKIQGSTDEKTIVRHLLANKLIINEITDDAKIIAI